MKKEYKKEKTVYAYIFWAHFFLAVTSKRIFKIVNVEDMGLKKKKKRLLAFTSSLETLK